MTLIILAAFFGFIALAAVLLVPIFRFLKREEASHLNHEDGTLSAPRSDNAFDDEGEIIQRR